MNYILKGDPKEVAKVLQENRIRADRGVIEFTPCQQESALDADSIATLREDLEAKTKACMEMAEGHVELVGVMRDVIAIIAENGITVPDDLVARLDQFGITVPKSPETVPNTAEIADNPGESVPETVPNNPDTVEDKKIVEAEDMTEVDLDDVKDTEESDTKEAPAPTPKKTRSKKSK